MLLAHIYVLYEIKSLFTNKFLALADFFFSSPLITLEIHMRQCHLAVPKL